MLITRTILVVCLIFLIFGYANGQTLQADSFKRGEEALAARNYNLAITEFTQHIQQKPDSSAAYFNRALAYNGVNNRELAIEDFSKAIELKPGFARAYLSRGLAYNQLGRDDLAMADFTKVIELEPNNANAYANRGEIYQKRRQLDEALADVNRAIQLGEKFGKAYYVRANIYTVRTTWQPAVDDMRAALRLDPKQISLYHPLAWMEMHVGNDQAAYESAVKFLDANGMTSDRSGWTLVAGYLALLRAGKRPEAESFIGRYPREKAAGVMPKKALEFLRGNLSEAELIAEASDDAIKRTDSRSIIGLKLLVDGKTEEAIKHLTWVRDNGKKSPTTYALAIVELANQTSKKIPNSQK